MRIALVTVSVAWIVVLCLVLFVAPAGSALAKDLPNLLLILPLGSAALCYAHAGNLKLPTGGWAFAGLLFPFAVPWILALRASAPDVEKMAADGDAEGLVRTLFDRRAELADNAYVALVKMDPERKVPALLRALPRAGRVSSRRGRGVISALSRSGHEEAIQALLTAVGDRRFRNRAEVARYLTGVKDPRVCQALLPLLSKRNERLRHNAMSTLGELHCADAAAPLAKILKKGNYWDRRIAATALGKLYSPDAVEPLLDALDDRVREVRDSAVEALGRLRDKRAVEPLLAMLEKEGRRTGGKDPGWSLRRSLAEALGKLDDPRACGPLLGRLADPASLVRDAAAEAYSRLRKTAQQQGMKVPEVEVVKCAGCQRWLRRSPLDALAILVKSAPDISGTQVYPCQACGAVFCIDCMARATVLSERSNSYGQTKRRCPKCFQPSGW